MTSLTPFKLSIIYFLKKCTNILYDLNYWLVITLIYIPTRCEYTTDMFIRSISTYLYRYGMQIYLLKSKTYQHKMDGISHFMEEIHMHLTENPVIFSLYNNWIQNSLGSCKLLSLYEEIGNLKSIKDWIRKKAKKHLYTNDSEFPQELPNCLHLKSSGSNKSRLSFRTQKIWTWFSASHYHDLSVIDDDTVK